MVKKIIYRKDHSALCMCQGCGSLHYVKSGESSAGCDRCEGRMPHLNIPSKFKSRSGLWYQGPARVPSAYLP
jgi:hypothetical protein